MTLRVHSEKEYNAAVDASEILFGKGTTDALKALPEELLLNVFEGVPSFSISKSRLENGMGIIDLLLTTPALSPPDLK